MDLLSFAAIKAFGGNRKMAQGRDVIVGVSSMEPNVGPLDRFLAGGKHVIPEEELVGRTAPLNANYSTVDVNCLNSVDINSKMPHNF